MRGRSVAIGLLGATTLIPLAVAAVSEPPGAPELVRSRPGIVESNPAAAPGLLAWAQRSPHTGHSDLFLRIAVGKPVRVNPAGTQAFPGTFDGQLLVYQQIAAEGGDSNLWVYDVGTGARRKLPGAINTDDWEFLPSLAEGWLLFGRGRDESIITPSPKSVLLRNLTTGEQRTLVSVEDIGIEVRPGQVSGRIAVWSVCRLRRGRVLCDSYRHDIDARVTQRLPNGGAAQQDTPSVSSSGLVYAVRSGTRCGENVRLVRLAPGKAAVPIMRFSPGTVVGKTVAHDDNSAGTRVYYDRFRCRSRRADVLRVLDRP